MKAPNYTKNNKVCTYGGYTGDNTVNKVIPHKLGRIPRIVFIFGSGFTSHYIIDCANGQILIQGAGNANLAVTAPDSVNFYVGNATSYGNSANTSGQAFKWVAIG